MNKKLIAELVVLFLITQAIGLYVANYFVQENIHTTIVSENPDDPLNTLGLIVYILVFTAVLLVMIKFLKPRLSYYLLKAFELLAIWGTSWIVFAVFLGDLIGLGLSFILVALRIALAKNIVLRNFASVIAIIGAGALIGVSLGIIPVILFIIALSVYDYIAVFKTKHMVSLAKAIAEKNLAFTVAMPTKEHKFELGTGDLVMPLVFASAALQSSGINSSFFVLAGSLIGLLFTINYSSKHVGKALPALPLQSILMLCFFAAAKVLGV